MLALSLVGLSVAGPHARDVLQSLTRTSLATADFPFMAFRRIDVGMIPAWVGRMTYSGDLGYELWVVPEEQQALFDALWAAGEPYGMRLFGFRALMSLRMEKSFGTWFREYRPIYTPLEAGMDRYLKLDHDFIGREALEAEMARGPERRLVTLVVDPHAEEPADVIGDEPIWHDGQVVGWVTSARTRTTAGCRWRSATCRPRWPSPARPARVMPASRSRSSATAARRACSPSPRSTRRACGCARDDPGAGRFAGAGLGRRHGRAGRPACRAAPRPRRDAVPGRRLRELRGRRRRGGVRPHVPDAGRDGMVVRRHPAVGGPPLLGRDDGPERPTPAVRHRSVDVAVVGLGASGRAAVAALEAEGREVLALDAGDGQEVVTIDHGPALVVRDTDADGRVALVHLHAHEVVLATGAAELQPVCPGNRLRGLLTTSAAVAAHAAGVELPDAIAVGDVPDGLPARRVAGELVRLDGDADGAVAAAVLDHDGVLETHLCRTVVVGLGSAPRDVLARMAPEGHVRVVGPATAEHALPPSPVDGIVCPCAGTTVEDLDGVWDRGFRQLELAKRASLCGTGTCQGTVCLPHLRAYLAHRSGAVPAPFTARPAARQLTLAEAAAAATSTRSAARRCTTSTCDSAPGSTSSAAGGGRGRTATCARSTTPSAPASASVTSRPSARWSSRVRTPSRPSNGSTPTTCTTSAPGGPGTCSC